MIDWHEVNQMDGICDECGETIPAGGLRPTAQILGADVTAVQAQQGEQFIPMQNQPLTRRG